MGNFKKKISVYNHIFFFFYHSVEQTTFNIVTRLRFVISCNSPLNLGLQCLIVVRTLH